MTSTATVGSTWRSPAPAVVSVLLGDGDGTFQPPVNYAAGINDVTALVAGDFNGDGRVDLAVAGNNVAGAGIVSVLLGNGDGTFQRPVTIAAGINDVTALVAGDFDGDGRVDLAVAGNNVAGAGVVAVLLGDGDGTFQPPVNYAAGTIFPSALVAGDFDGRRTGRPGHHRQRRRVGAAGRRRRDVPTARDHCGGDRLCGGAGRG